MAGVEVEVEVDGLLVMEARIELREGGDVRTGDTEAVAGGPPNGDVALRKKPPEGKGDLEGEGTGAVKGFLLSALSSIIW